MPDTFRDPDKFKEVKLITLRLASPDTVRGWAETRLPDGKILGIVYNANTLHHNTLKPLKGGLFCERIFGPVKDFQCACGIQKDKSLSINHSTRQFCLKCNVEYTWSLKRRYQLGYIRLVSPVTHLWYVKESPSFIAVMLDMKRKTLDYITYCTYTLTIDSIWKSGTNNLKFFPKVQNTNSLILSSFVKKKSYYRTEQKKIFQSITKSLESWQERRKSGWQKEKNLRKSGALAPDFLPFFTSLAPPFFPSSFFPFPILPFLLKKKSLTFFSDRALAQSLSLNKATLLCSRFFLKKNLKSEWEKREAMFPLGSFVSEREKYPFVSSRSFASEERQMVKRRKKAQLFSSFFSSLSFPILFSKASDLFPLELLKNGNKSEAKAFAFQIVFFPSQMNKSRELNGKKKLLKARKRERLSSLSSNSLFLFKTRIEREERSKRLFSFSYNLKNEKNAKNLYLFCSFLYKHKKNNRLDKGEYKKEKADQTWKDFWNFAYKLAKRQIMKNENQLKEEKKRELFSVFHSENLEKNKIFFQGKKEISKDISVLQLLFFVYKLKTNKLFFSSAKFRKKKIDKNLFFQFSVWKKEKSLRRGKKLCFFPLLPIFSLSPRKKSSFSLGERENMGHFPPEAKKKKNFSFFSFPIPGEPSFSFTQSLTIVSFPFFLYVIMHFFKNYLYIFSNSLQNSPKCSKVGLEKELFSQTGLSNKLFFFTKKKNLLLVLIRKLKAVIESWRLFKKLIFSQSIINKNCDFLQKKYNSIYESRVVTHPTFDHFKTKLKNEEKNNKKSSTSFAFYSITSMKEKKLALANFFFSGCLSNPLLNTLKNENLKSMKGGSFRSRLFLIKKKVLTFYEKASFWYNEQLLFNTNYVRKQNIIDSLSVSFTLCSFLENKNSMNVDQIYKICGNRENSGAKEGKKLQLFSFPLSTFGEKSKIEEERGLNPPTFSNLNLNDFSFNSNSGSSNFYNSKVTTELLNYFNFLLVEKIFLIFQFFIKISEQKMKTKSESKKKGGREKAQAFFLFPFSPRLFPIVKIAKKSSFIKSFKFKKFIYQRDLCFNNFIKIFQKLKEEKHKFKLSKQMGKSRELFSISSFHIKEIGIKKDSFFYKSIISFFEKIPKNGLKLKAWKKKSDFFIVEKGELFLNFEFLNKDLDSLYFLQYTSAEKVQFLLYKLNNSILKALFQSKLCSFIGKFFKNEICEKRKKCHFFFKAKKKKKESFSSLSFPIELLGFSHPDFYSWDFISKILKKGYYSIFSSKNLFYSLSKNVETLGAKDRKLKNNNFLLNFSLASAFQTFYQKKYFFINRSLGDLIFLKQDCLDNNRAFLKGEKVEEEREIQLSLFSHFGKKEVTASFLSPSISSVEKKVERLSLVISRDDKVSFFHNLFVCNNSFYLNKLLFLQFQKKFYRNLWNYFSFSLKNNSINLFINSRKSEIEKGKELKLRPFFSSRLSPIITKKISFKTCKYTKFNIFSRNILLKKHLYYKSNKISLVQNSYTSVFQKLIRRKYNTYLLPKIFIKKEKKEDSSLLNSLYNNIYVLSNRYFWSLEDELKTFLNYINQPSRPDDIFSPKYENRLIKFNIFRDPPPVLGGGLIQKLLAEFNPNESIKILMQLENQLKKVNILLRSCTDFLEARKLRLKRNYMCRRLKYIRSGSYKFTEDFLRLSLKKKLSFSQIENLEKNKNFSVLKNERKKPELFSFPQLLGKKDKKISFNYFNNSLKITNLRSFLKESRPEWMVLSLLPVLPPDLRPILQIGNQVASSDLNRLYQKVLYRNERLKRFLKDSTSTNSPQMKFAYRLLQEAVDNLIDNGKGKGNAETDNRGLPLKSLTELLKGKKGRFRQNLLGKRVDYSGRSVIVVGPRLRLHECGLPKEMAIELFMPFLIQKIFQSGKASTILGAKKILQNDSNRTWEFLNMVLRENPVLLNRAPTLHRFGFQAFQPRLVEGKAILLHPLVCPAFNADFDGDQMAVHVPITVEAKVEAWKIMLARNHLLSAATGEVILVPSQDMVLGSYYLTAKNPKFYEKRLFLHQYNYIFGTIEEVLRAYESQKISLHSIIWLRWNHKFQTNVNNEKLLELQINRKGQISQIFTSYSRSIDKRGDVMNSVIQTTPGRVLFHNFILKNRVK
uniref:DNA-directed RNA polymerase subunit n=1 Tax=Stigeoclonium helveticum TaxID=55999 RepID=Q06SJ9_STIHE|nr:beta' subunit of RNA polymerase [Stigeoclonium helveticum]ABF60190.1 beta' subunit of RNA polymerase [Stigeoclonium helveticum]